jgi:hypothetical protein
MTLAIGTYISFRTRDDEPTGFNFQNFFPRESRVYNNQSYLFANFGFSGATVDLQGSNIQATLVFGHSLLSNNFIKQACDNYWIVRIRTVWLDTNPLEETGTYLEEVYGCTQYDHNLSRINLNLGSPLDAVRAEIPQRVLSQQLVGSLPTTGAINVS